MDIQAVINEAVRAGIQAGRLQSQGGKNNNHTFKMTERRLYAYPIILARIQATQEELAELEAQGQAPERSKSLVRFSRSGVRLTPEEILEGLLQDLRAKIAADQYEADTIAGALKTIKGDRYAAAIVGRFIEGKDDEEIAVAIPCDSSTVRRNRGRLLRKLTVWLYGAEAL